jgi:hypothetical protein
MRPVRIRHLARDIYNLTEIAKVARVSVPIISHIKESNDVPVVGVKV